MPMRLIVAYGLIFILVVAAAFTISHMRRRAAADRAMRRAHRSKTPR